MLMRELRAVFGEAAFSAKCRATDHNGLVELAKESQPSQFMDWENIPNPLMENHGDELQVGKNKNFRHELARRSLCGMINPAFSRGMHIEREPLHPR